MCLQSFPKNVAPFPTIDGWGTLLLMPGHSSRFLGAGRRFVSLSRPVLGVRRSPSPQLTLRSRWWLHKWCNNFLSSDGGRTGTEPRKNQEKFASGIWVRERERIFVAGIRFVWKMHRTLRGASAAWIRDVWRLVKGDEDGGVVYGAPSLRPWGEEKGTFLFVIFRGPDWPSALSRRSANGSGPLSRHVCYEI